MKKLSLFSIAILSLTTLSSCGYHHGKRFHEKHKKHMEEYFNKADENQDGFISKKEYQQFSLEKFEEIDTNNDNKLSKEEMQQFKKNKYKNYRKDK